MRRITFPISGLYSANSRIGWRLTAIMAGKLHGNRMRSGLCLLNPLKDRSKNRTHMFTCNEALHILLTSVRLVAALRNSADRNKSEMESSDVRSVSTYVQHHQRALGGTSTSQGGARLMTFHLSPEKADLLICAQIFQGFVEESLTKCSPVREA